MLDFLEQEEQISPALLREVRAFRAAQPLPDPLQARVPRPRYHYYGRAIWEQAIAALLCGKNLLLTGGTDGGNSACILHNAEALAKIPPLCPVVIAGNRSASAKCAKRPSFASGSRLSAPFSA